MSVPARVASGIGILCLSVALFATGSTAMGQATPTGETIEAPIVNAGGETVGTLHVSESDTGVTFSVILNAGALAPGEHGIHIHETGSCDSAGEMAFELAGDHFNPTETHHGAPGAEMSHAGDLGNLTTAEDGSADFTISTERLTLAPGEATSLADADGSALLIHSEADDLTTDPSGESGDRVLCSVVAASTSATPGASPVASPVA
jgi:Cu-Zn family superoxide dismutase